MFYTSSACGQSKTISGWTGWETVPEQVQQLTTREGVLGVLLLVVAAGMGMFNRTGRKHAPPKGTVADTDRSNEYVKPT